MTMAVTVFFPGNWNMSLAPRDHQVTIRLDWSPMPSTLSPLSSGWSKLKTQVASSTTDADYDKVISQSPLHGIPPTMFLKCRKRWRNIAKLSLYQQVVCLSTASSSKITSTIWCIWIGTWHGSQSYIRVTSIHVSLALTQEHVKGPYHNFPDRYQEPIAYDVTTAIPYPDRRH